MKKPLVIAPYPYLPYFSGGQKFISQFLDWLGRKTKLTVIGTVNNDSTSATHYRFIPLLKRSFSRYYDRSLVKKITAEIAAGGYDAVIWEHPYFHWLAKRVKKKTGVRTILHTHNIEFQRFKSTGKWWWPILKSYEKKAFQRADHILFITPVDKQWAIDNWQIDPKKCIDLPFGIEVNGFPMDKAGYRSSIAEKHNIAPNEKIILFNGLLQYGPNLDAVKHIISHINLFLRTANFPYKIIICGKGLPADVEAILKKEWGQNIIYAGFVDDIIPYFKAADIFLNPVLTGGGIKTKMVEAIAFGTTVIAYRSGASGIIEEVCGQKLVVIEDNDWKSFAQAIIDHASDEIKTPQSFYDYYYWGNAIERVLNALPD